MQNFSETIDITVIVALIAAIAAILAPLATELLRQRSIRKEKSLEYYFTAKTEAYTRYLRVTSRIAYPASLEDLKDLSDAMQQAVIFSSKDTGRKIALYTKYLKDQIRQQSFDDEHWDSYGDSYIDMLSALHLELENYCK